MAIELASSSVKLSRLEVKLHTDKPQAVVTLTGDEKEIAAIFKRLEKQEYSDKIGFLYQEYGKSSGTLTIHASVVPQDKKSADERVADLIETIHTMTFCGLGGLKLSAVAIPVSDKNSATPYSPGVVIVPNIDRNDKDNVLGHYAMEVIRRAYASRTDVIPDPHSQDEAQLRLIDIRQISMDPRTSMTHAEKILSKIERNFGIYYASMDISLAGLHTMPLPDSSAHALSKHEKQQLALYEGFLSEKSRPPLLTEAKLRGHAKLLDWAAEILKQKLPPKTFRLALEDKFLKVRSPENELSITRRLMDALPKCKLPIDINAATTFDGHEYYPVLEAVVRSDVPPGDHRTTGNALAGYIGLQVVEPEIVRTEEAINRRPARVIVKTPFFTNADAQKKADELKEQIAGRLRRGDSPLQL